MVVVQVVDTKCIHGTKYFRVRWLSTNGGRKESWIPEVGFKVNPLAYKSSTFADISKEADEVEKLSGCNTSKDKMVRRQKIAGINIVVFPCGTILSMDELFGCESLSQVLLPLYSLFEDPSLRRDVKVLMHDNACKFATFVKKRKDGNEIMEHIASLDMRVDRHHYKNHVERKCKLYHNPDDCPLLEDVNTSVMEQVNSWFGRYRHSARYMNHARFPFYLLVACHLNNKFRQHKKESCPLPEDGLDDEECL